MTRAPRSRKKKSVATDVATAEAVVVTAAEASTDPATSLDLPLPAPDAVEASDVPVVMAEAAEGVSIDPVIASVVESVYAEIGLAPLPAVAASEPSSMRIDITEERSQIGPRLRAAREVRGWSREDVAHRLHVPTTVIADIEAERFERLGAPIYVRGYLSKYAQLVELPMVVVNRAIEGINEPALKASTNTPRPAAGWERYRVAVIGGVVTLAVAIPVLTLVANRGIHAPVPQVRSLDETEMGQPISAPLVQNVPTGPVIEPEVVAGSGSEGVETLPPAAVETLPETPSPATADVAQAPVMASMAGFSAPATAGAHILEAHFREDSWIEIFDLDGRVIEQNLVRAGQTRRYESTGAVSIKIGNVSGVDVRADGNPIDLAPHARANVARLRLFEAAAATP